MTAEQTKDIYLDGSGGPDVWIFIVALQVTEPFLLDWAIICLTNSFHSWEFGEMTIEISTRICCVESKIIKLYFMHHLICVLTPLHQFT